MIDFVKITIKGQGVADLMRQNENLTYYQDRNKMTATLKNVRIGVHDSGRVEVSGSLHHYWNNGGNWNDFGRLDLFDTILEVCQTLQINPEQAKIQNLEYGVNICPPIDPTELLKRVISYKDEIFVRTPYTKGYFVEATKKDYFVKCYDKGKHQDREEWVLRFERKAMKSRDLKRAKVQNLADLLHANNLRTLGEMLIETFDGVLIAEPLDLSKLTATERKTYEIVTNAKEWERLRKQHKRRGYLMDCYERLVTKHTNGRPTLKQQVRELIATKWSDLLDQKNWAVFTNLQGVEEQHQPNEEIGRFSPTYKNDNLGGFPDLCIVGKPTNSESTEIELQTLQKVVVDDGGGGSKNIKCGHCRKVVEEPIFRGVHGGVFCNERCEQMKKNRNDSSNPRNGFKRKYQRSTQGVFLFDVKSFVRLSKQQEVWLLDGVGKNP